MANVIRSKLAGSARAMASGRSAAARTLRSRGTMAVATALLDMPAGGAGSARAMSEHAAPPAAIPEYSSTRIEEVFGNNCFNDRAQARYLAPKVFKAVRECVRQHKAISPDLAEAYAAGLLRWAVERGATHYTHWFHPLTGKSAQKHDSFVTKTGDHVMSSFSGKTLSLGEPDASSFPSGGLRETHEARGYTVWDPSSPCFIINHGTGSTLYIPTVFFSWKGQPQDEKTPLLASTQALNREALDLLRAAGDDSHSFVHADSGVEQEFFLVDYDFVLRRPDIMQTGRTLFGAAPPKGQALDDHYFTDLTQRTMFLINEAELEMWKLGIAQTTRHKEVAPGQYEIAPVFSPSSVASDNNVLAMEVLHRVAHKHGMEVLFHEKPFAGLNGSGKHNNWSIGSDQAGTFFQPGPIPQTNLTFMLFLTATVRALDRHQDLIRIAVASASNDHRLGANEAPPANISMYLGSDNEEAVEKFLNKDPSPSTASLEADDLGFSCLPHFKKDSTDRNRTSPFAFTGNKFEFRAVGSTHFPHRSNYIINTAVAESCRDLAAAINSAAGDATGDERREIVEEVLRETLREHQRIIFNGDCYSDEWHAEAEKRGLLNLVSTPEALAEFDTPKNSKLFSDMGVWTPEVMTARSNMAYEEYITKLTIEANSALVLINTQILPAAVATQEKLANGIAAVNGAGGKAPASQVARLERINGLIDSLVTGAEQLEADVNKPHTGDNDKDATFARDALLGGINKIRESADALEGLCDKDAWTLPNYHEMLFTGQDYDVTPSGAAF